MSTRLTQEIIRQFQNISVGERLYLMEILLNSLKQEIKSTKKQEQPQWKRFSVRLFNLGQEIHSNRDILYAERGV